MTLTTEDGTRVAFDAMLRGRVTAMQLMFTGCNATCPIQGALFAALAPRVADDGQMRLLSLSIDPLGDGPTALRAWRQRFGAYRHWTAAVPGVKDVDLLLDFVRGRAAGVDRHTAQIYLFDHQARLTYRTAELPAAAAVAQLMKQVAAQR